MFFQCPSCGAAIAIDDPDDASSVMIVRVFTDGRVVCSPLVSSALLGRCGRCAAIFRLPETGSECVLRPTLHQRFFACPPQPCAPEDYLNAIEAGIAEAPSIHQAFRLEAWRLGNDPYRRMIDSRKPTPQSRPSWWTVNLLSLTEILSSTDPWLALLRAEALRELGEFSACLAQLRIITGNGDDRELWVATLIRLALENNPHVQAITK